MPSLGDIYFGGSEGNKDNVIYNSGIGFYLKSTSKISRKLKFDNNWEVEIKEGHQSIVARCIDILNNDEIIKSGFKFSQTAIDMVSVAYGEDIAIQDQGKYYFILYNDNGIFHLKQVIGFPIIHDISAAQIEIRDKDGNIVPQPPAPDPKLSQALRYYRLSQNSSDLYEAYRNLFLSFEYVLTDLFPRNITSTGRPESWNERNRYESALNELDKILPLKNFVPPNITGPAGDPAGFIMITQYDNIRCKLFHAKSDPICRTETNITPYDDFNPKDIQEAYENLMRLVKEILMKFYNITLKGGGVTYVGFKLMMNSTGLHSISVCSDKTPLECGISDSHIFQINKNSALCAEDLEKDIQYQLKPIFSKADELISPNKTDFIMFDNLNCNWDYCPGMVAISLILNKSDLKMIDGIFRTSLFYISNMFDIAYIAHLSLFYNKDGLFLKDVDKFEIIIYINLENKGSPKKFYYF